MVQECQVSEVWYGVGEEGYGAEVSGVQHNDTHSLTQAVTEAELAPLKQQLAQVDQQVKEVCFVL